MARSPYISQYCYEEPWKIEALPTTGLVDTDSATGFAIGRCRLIAIGSDDTQAVQASGTGTALIGVIGWSASYNRVGDAMSVIMWSPSFQLRAGAAIAVGDYLTSDAEGRAIPAASGQQVVGRATSTAAAADDLFNASIQPGVMP